MLYSVAVAMEKGTNVGSAFYRTGSFEASQSSIKQISKFQDSPTLRKVSIGGIASAVTYFPMEKLNRN